MALDHYVLPVHLKQFCSPALGDVVLATRKYDLRPLQCDARSVCRIDEHGADGGIAVDQAVGDFLGKVDATYDAALATLRDGRPDPDCIWSVAGFVAWVLCCAPAALRLHRAPLDAMIAADASPPAGNAALAASHRDPLQPVDIGAINTRVAMLGNTRWEILVNGDPTTPFFTSDYPVALEARDAYFANWIVPLAPDLAIRVIPDLRLRGTKADLSFAKFSFRPLAPRRSEVIDANRLIVRSAEDMIFYRDDRPWIADFIAKNRHYRIEAVAQRVQSGQGYYNAATQRIVAHRADAGRGDAAG